MLCLEKLDRVLEAPMQQVLVAVEWNRAAVFQLGACREVKAVDSGEEEERPDTLVEIARFATECVERITFRKKLPECERAADVVERAIVLSPKTRSVIAAEIVVPDAWIAAKKNWSALVTDRARLHASPVAEILKSVSADFAPGVMTSDARLAQPTTAGHIERRDVGVRHGKELRFWVVDERLSEFLLSFVIALLGAPLILVLVRLKSGESLSRWPAASATLLSLIWWVCLQGSGLGFAAVALAATVAVLHALRRVLAQS